MYISNSDRGVSLLHGSLNDDRNKYSPSRSNVLKCRGNKYDRISNMKKIPTIFKRNPDNMKLVLNEVNEDCRWVFEGGGVATRKYDGTCCLIKEGKLYKRREIKKGKQKPDNFVLADHDENTGKTVGWLPVDFDSKDDKWHVEAFTNADKKLEDGTYELLGKKIQGNPEKYDRHTLLKHSEAQVFLDVPREYHALQNWLKEKDIEGLVFHHPDGRMGKIKKRDFGQERRVGSEFTNALPELDLERTQCIASVKNPPCSMSYLKKDG